MNMKIGSIAFNNYGGFSEDGTEYIIVNTNTPVPWCNILANERFGTLISSKGTVYSYFKNSSEYKLTSWSNDFAEFKQGESFKGIFEEGYNMSYGFGYTKIVEETDKIKKEMDIFVPINDDLKVQYITLENTSNENKELEIGYSLDLVLGIAKEMTKKYILTRKENERMEFKNPYHKYFGDYVSYLKVVEFKEDKNEEIEDSNVEIEYNIETSSVSIKSKIDAGDKIALAILFGTVENNGEEIVDGAVQSKIDKIIEKYSKKSTVLKEYKATKDFWIGKVVKKFKTGDEYLDIMANGWLLYQTIVSRMFSRTGFYQAGGAFGFRDQLQDSLALLKTWPELARKQILKHSSKQFERGDVLHWWHEHNSSGIKTYFSDDYLWLPYVVSEYVLKTNDVSILKEKVLYLKDRDMGENREIYDVFEMSDVEESIYGHCIRAIKYGLSRKGPHNILEIGDGDWNDGFSNIKGESVWLTFFMMDILKRFSSLAEMMFDEVTKMHFDSERHVLKHNVVLHGYYSEYFARAFFPNGESIGTEESLDCKIDLISQAWAAIALKDYPDSRNEIESSLNAAEKYLVDKENKIVKLLYPPFDNPKYNPGYIKAYVPGVRENGGQYTHAATWLAKAYFEIGEKEKAMEILKMICPIYHSNNKEIADIYMVEPYVMAADVYSNKDHVGRGGWTWYTGSASWMYKIIEDNFKEEI